ncbi:hypothetical protein COV21_01860 [Candidatus Woesearchaeota archaeon CG10_big_fil_rev_8_21_14_0_10_45_5]|nr:MAG: hypothetical protein COV21_01860 [Candidatus Woesearchaeota archaeon CG10_big_fil_rev_8_21_14_0_10_45_5]PIU30082.1 MAG: hypothetical protein COT07_02620 [Candidatus Woesearchaeota archaeon CG07_land_8_20_14_0_80_44_23]
MAEISAGIKKLIEKNAMALATVDEFGKPHCIAVGFVKVVSKNQVLITDNYMAETYKNIMRNKNVAFVVWNRDWEENASGYELRGSAKYFKKGRWYEAIKRIPENKGEPCKGVILVTISRIKKLA